MHDEQPEYLCSLIILFKLLTLMKRMWSVRDTEEVMDLFSEGKVRSEHSK